MNRTADATRPDLIPAWVPPEQAADRAAVETTTDARRIVEGIRHGLTGYIKHGCRCDTCLDADRHNRQKRRERLTQGNIPHGTVKGYTYYRCRCQDCKQARAEHRQAARIMIPKDILGKATAKARGEGRDLSSVVTDVLNRYVGAGEIRRTHTACQTCFCQPPQRVANHGAPFTPEEIALIKSDAPAKQVAAQIGRTEGSVYAMRNQLRHGRNTKAKRKEAVRLRDMQTETAQSATRLRRPYTDTELKLLASDLPDVEVAKMINRTMWAVRSKRIHMGKRRTGNARPNQTDKS